MRFDYIEKRFANLFSKYSLIVVKYPYLFIIFPLILTGLLGSGIKNHPEAFVKDDLDLYTPTDAKARSELKQLDDLFHIDDHDPFYATRRYDIKRAGYIIVTGEKEESDILNPLVMQASMQLWSIIQSLTIEDKESHKRINYPSICVKFPMPQEFTNAIANFINPNVTSPETICVSNPLVEAFKYFLLSDQIFANRTFDDITLENLGDSISLDAIGMTHLLGGIIYDDQKRIAGAKAILLPYALRHSTPEEDELAEKWELKLADFLLSYNSPIIKTSWWTYETLSSESSRDRDHLIRMLVPCFLAVTLYTIFSCCVTSWIRSRPWLALGGVISAALAIISGVGLLLHCKYKMTSVAYSMPFIIFSVGVDNIFIVLSAWRATNYDSSLEERMSETFSDAAVSITVTSLTNFISFCVGCLTPFPSIQMFCVYAVVAVFFTYVYQLTFFAGIMVLTSRREVNERNCLTFMKVSKKEKKNNCKKVIESFPKDSRYINFDEKSYKNNNYSITSSISEDSYTKSFYNNHPLSRFFRTTYCDILLHPLVKALVLLVFVFYLVIAVYGCLNIKMGLEPNDLLPENSYGKRTLRMAEKYFSDYGSSLHVWMYNLSHYDFGRKKIWNTLEREIELYEHTEFTGSSDSWLRIFLEFIKNSGLLITDENFVYLLKNVFLSQPTYHKYQRDVVFDPSGEYLEASRVPISLRYVGTSNQSRAMHFFRRLAATSELPTGVYADFFQFAEQYNAVLPGTLSSIAIAGGAVIFVSLIFIPVPVASLWVSFCIISINVGILGFMTFWSVRLDFISMVTIVMSIGFCVDFAAHLSYNYSKGKNLSPSKRIRNALYCVGTPIIQSATSTILGVSFMYFTESYIFKSFFKTIVLVIVLGALHGLVILPVLFTVFHCEKSHIKDSATEETASTNTGDINIQFDSLNKSMQPRIPRIQYPDKIKPFYVSNDKISISTPDYVDNNFNLRNYPFSPPLMTSFNFQNTFLQQSLDRNGNVKNVYDYQESYTISNKRLEDSLPKKDYDIEIEDDDDLDNNIYMNPSLDYENVDDYQ
uniref:SSD domain-containing protein n=1 Tax=Strongyloides papillosus TaxID=174720 RepID=A0A0N5BAG7_STREA